MLQMKVGTFHNRPCVRTIWHSLYNSRPRWIPVLGPVHSDLVFSPVITTVAPVGAGGAQVKLENLPDNRHPLESYWRMMRRRLHSPYPPIHRTGKLHGLRNSTRPTGEKR